MAPPPSGRRASSLRRASSKEKSAGSLLRSEAGQKAWENARKAVRDGRMRVRTESGFLRPLSDTQPGLSAKALQRSRSLERDHLDVLRPAAQIKCDGEVRGMDASRDGQVLATGDSSGKAMLWNFRTGEVIHCFDCGAPVWSIDLSFDGSRVACGSGTEKGSTGAFWVWSTSTADAMVEVKSASAVRSVEITNSNAVAAWGTEKGLGVVWDLERNEQLCEVDAGIVYRILLRCPVL